MNWTIDFTKEFSRGAKILKKRYRSFLHDLESFKESIKENPFQGVELVPGIRKIRMEIKAKSKGKSGGARVITLTYYISQVEGKVQFLIIYDKSDADTVDVNVVKEQVEELGFNLTELNNQGLLTKIEDTNTEDSEKDS